MREGDLTWLIGGPQGGGINVSAETFAKYAARTGLRVFANIEYHSNIMGEHSYYRVRASREQRHSVLDQVNVVVALDEETLIGRKHAHFTSHRGHVAEVESGGAVVFDTATKFNPETHERKDVVWVGLSMMDLLREALREFGREGDANRLRVMTNTVALGASVFVIGGDIGGLAEIYTEEFTGRRAQIGEMNARAAAIGYEAAQQALGGRAPYDLKSMTVGASLGAKRPMMLKGYASCGMAKLKAGLHIQTYYPISPATDESVFLESLQRDQNVLVVQCEDEISSIQMAIGAANAGARAATSTSGPGFALMVEGIGYASITEVSGPVIFLWQRGGPSTGLPTREEQGDLLFALHPAQGDFPHIVVAPGDDQEIYEDSFEVFNWVDRYHMPAVVLLDKYLQSSYKTVDELTLDNPVIDRGPRFNPADLQNGHGDGNGHRGGYEDGYLAFAMTESGVTPRAIPGQEGGIFWATSDEHNPRGHITEDATNRIEMMDKRMGKLELAAREIPSARKIGVYGPADADLTIVGWGSVKGSVLDAMDVLAKEGVKVNFVQIRLMRPFPVQEVTDALAGAKRLVLVECNYSGQLGGLVREMTGIHIPQYVVKYDGRPFSEEELVEALRQAISTDDARIHVSHLSA
ncbi:MAG: 2-oxoglutarate/2-oxoacid ferredoxin oxidoreductase subunit alpha [Chloroflexota bacterium]|nr:2-oxoglutarate/2-oxoacid ferredoxin oxidoreductase subunit alpha [Chloroflexota bacterium]